MRRSSKSYTRISVRLIRTSQACLSQKNSLIFLVRYKRYIYTGKLLELAQNPLVRRVIAVLDKNKDGNISFLEFVQGLNSLSAGAS